MMWSKWGWSEADTVGSADLPPGRYLHAVTTPPGCAPLHVIGVCVPYGRYSGHKDEKLNNWDGHKQYSVALKPLIAPHRTRTIIAGDFNMPFYGSLWGFDSTSQRELLNALTDYRIITEHLADPDSVKPLIDHIALTPDLHTSNLQAVGRLGLSDHPLTVADIQSDSVR
jgi:endonuclease/exonuclease/phosphatase family metal-dependent hydrolase